MEQEYYLIFGLVFACLIVILGFMSSIKKSVMEEKQPIQELNITITRLNANFENMLANDIVRDNRISKHGEEIDRLENKLYDTNHIVANHESRIQSLEKKGSV